MAARGHLLVLGARRIDRISRIANEINAAGNQAHHHSLDVTNLKSVNASATAARDRFGPIDVLVNNAGVMPLSPMSSLRVDEWDQTIDVNIRGVLHGIAAMLPKMLKRKQSHIVNIALTAGLQASARAAVYCASKFAVRAISEALRQENRDLRVTVVCPGLTRSKLIDGIADPQVQAAIRASADRSSIPAEAIAEAIAYAVAQPDAVDVNASARIRFA